MKDCNYLLSYCLTTSDYLFCKYKIFLPIFCRFVRPVSTKHIESDLSFFFRAELFLLYTEFTYKVSLMRADRVPVRG